jgi:hypothetical protein
MRNVVGNVHLTVTRCMDYCNLLYGSTRRIGIPPPTRDLELFCKFSIVMMTDAPGVEGGRRSGPCPAKALPTLICAWIIDPLARSRLTKTQRQGTMQSSGVLRVVRENHFLLKKRDLRAKYGASLCILFTPEEIFYVNDWKTTRSTC